jgi:hypothetical protein
MKETQHRNKKDEPGTGSSKKNQYIKYLTEKGCIRENSTNANFFNT